MTSVLTKSQKKVFGPREYQENGRTYRITAHVRYDDQCGNGHNTFAITADVDRKAGGRWVEDSGGCCHDLIAEHFPELAPLVKWHLCSSDGPMHYVANTVYHVSDRDCWGLRKGEFRPLDKDGKPQWTLAVNVSTPVAANERPAPIEWERWGRTGEGKEPDLDAARSSAIWPDAADEELTAPGLEDRLRERLPALMVEFRAAVESLGFSY